MRNALKSMMRKVFSSASVTARHDLYATLHGGLRYELRREILTEYILHDDASGVVTERYLDHDIIVSLTSYGHRIHDVAYAIESLMQQTMKANRIVLWLSKDLEKLPLPRALVMQQRRGLEIKFCKDIRSYTKLIPQLKESPEDTIITVDDDVLYNYDILEHLIIAYLKHPDMIHCGRVHRIQFDSIGNPLPYNMWEWNCSIEGVDKKNFLTGVGGVLYPPHCLDNEVFNESVFMELCPNADDVWFTAMAMKKGTPINKVFTRDEYGEDFILIPTPLEKGLAVKNIGMSGNDCQIEAVFSKYALFDKIK